MDEFRYGLGVFLVFIMPVVIAFWICIHAGSGYWKKKDPRIAYSVAGLIISMVMIFSYFWLDLFLGHDLGTNIPIFVLGSVIYLLSFVLWRPVKRFLDFRTFAGLPEVKNEKIDLITAGPFSIVRHPRYLMVGIGVLGWCLMSHYSGVYWVGLFSIAGLMLIIYLEERDLIFRFGSEYEDYQKRVPAVVPSLEGIGRFLKEFRLW